MLFTWKGSFMVTQVSERKLEMIASAVFFLLQLSAERAVSFDNGPDGSISEDLFFALKAFSMGYSFDWIEGEMHEKSPFTIHDFLQQRKRWFQGTLLAAHSSDIPLRFRLGILSIIFSAYAMLLSLANIAFVYFYPLPSINFMNIVLAFYASIGIYTFIFGVLKSFPFRQFGIIKFLACIVASVCIIPLNVILENVAIIWGLTTSRNRFYVVKK